MFARKEKGRIWGWSAGDYVPSCSSQGTAIASAASAVRTGFFQFDFTVLHHLQGRWSYLRARAALTSTLFYYYWTKVENFLQSMADTFLRPSRDTARPRAHLVPRAMPRWITQMLSGIHFARQLMSWYQCIFPSTFNNLNFPDQTFIRDFTGFVSKTLNSIISW